MAGLFHFLEAQPFLVIFGVVAAGMYLGKQSVKGIALGSVVCIILAGLLISIAAHETAGVSLALPEMLKSIFFNLFIFAVGIKIGPQFFSGLERDGWHMVIVGAVVGILAPVLAYVCGWVFDLPQGAVAGVLAGSNNSSAAFGTASAAVQAGAVTLRDGNTAQLLAGTLSAAFALCYTVSEVQYVLFMKWLPALARFDAPKAAQEFESAVRGQRSAVLPGTAEAGDLASTSLAVRAYRVDSRKVAGRTIADIRTAAPRVSIELVRRGGAWLDVQDSTALQPGDEVVVSAPLEAQVKVRDAVGPELPDEEARALTVPHTVDVVVSRADAAGRPVPDVMRASGLAVSAVFRVGEELPAGPGTIVKRGDVLRVTGTESRLAGFGARVGQIVRANHTSDVLTLAIGLLIGALLGAIPVPLFGVRISFGAAAVLVTGILFGWIKTRRPTLGGQISEGARQLMATLGLNVFTAVLAINSGLAVYQVITTGPVWALIGSCLIVSSIPALIAWWVGRHVLGINAALLMGAVAGARQNTASLHAAQAETRSAVPGIGYPVPLAITTVVLSVVNYFFVIFF